MAIGVKASASISSLGMVMGAIIDGTCSKEYILEIVALETSGKSRAEKVNRTIRRMTVNNPLLPYIMEHKDEYLANTKGGANRCVVYSALMCAAYPLFYDTVTLLGKYFHAQDEIETNLIFSKLSEKYGASVDSTIGFNSVMKMLVEAGIIMRPKTGVYRACRMNNISDFARDIYQKAFLHNNPTYSDNDDVRSNSFFEYIN